MWVQGLDVLLTLFCLILFVFNSGKIVFNEIEDSVGARMIYSLTDIDIIKEYCNYISCEVKNG